MPAAKKARAGKAKPKAKGKVGAGKKKAAGKAAGRGGAGKAGKEAKPAAAKPKSAAKAGVMRGPPWCMSPMWVWWPSTAALMLAAGVMQGSIMGARKTLAWPAGSTMPCQCVAACAAVRQASATVGPPSSGMADVPAAAQTSRLACSTQPHHARPCCFHGHS